MLRCKKVVLRALERDDLKRLHELNRHVELGLLGRNTWTPEPLAAWEKEFDKRLDEQEKSRFVIEVDGTVIGDIHLHGWKNPRAGTVEMAVGIYDPGYVGKGYGRDAIAVFLDWCFRIQNYRRVLLHTSATNERAIRAYRACGFVEEGRMRADDYVDGHYVDTLVMGILRAEWEARHR